MEHYLNPMNTVGIGDPAYFDFQSDGKLDHAVIISKIDPYEVYYAANSSRREEQPMGLVFEMYENLAVHVVHMK